MPLPQQTRIYHSNRYSADSACLHCRGIIRHETWCVSQNPRVSYAYKAVLDAERLSLGDRLILHALGVGWVELGRLPVRPTAKIGGTR